jgi:hypothetical protein
MLVSKIVLIGALTVAAGAAAFGMQIHGAFGRSGGTPVAAHVSVAQTVPASTGSIAPSTAQAAKLPPLVLPPLVIGSDKDYGWGPFHPTGW